MSAETIGNIKRESERTEKVFLFQEARDEIESILPGSIEKESGVKPTYLALAEKWEYLKKGVQRKAVLLKALAAAFSASLPIYKEQAIASEYGETYFSGGIKGLSISSKKFYESGANIDEFNEFELKDGDYQLKLGNFSPKGGSVEPSPFIKINKVVKKENGDLSYEFSSGLTIMDLGYQTYSGVEQQLVAVPKIIAEAQKEISIDENLKIVLAGIGQAYGNIMHLFRQSIDIGNAFEGAFGGSVVARIKGGTVSFYAIKEVAGNVKDIQQQSPKFENFSMIEIQNQLGVHLGISLRGSILTFNPEVAQTTWGKKFGVEVSKEKPNKTIFARFSKIQSEHPFLIPSGEEIEAGVKISNKEKDETLDFWIKREADKNLSAGLTARWKFGRASTHKEEYLPSQSIDARVVNVNPFMIDFPIQVQKLGENHFIEKGEQKKSEYTKFDPQNDSNLPAVTVNGFEMLPTQEVLDRVWFRDEGNYKNGQIFTYEKNSFPFNNSETIKEFESKGYILVSDAQKLDTQFYLQKTEYQYVHVSGQPIYEIQYSFFDASFEYISENVKMLEQISQFTSTTEYKLGKIARESLGYQEFVKQMSALAEEEKIMLLGYLSASFYNFNYNDKALAGESQEVAKSEAIQSEELLGAMQQSMKDGKKRPTTVCGGISKFLANLGKETGINNIYIISGNTDKIGHIANLIATKDGFLILDRDEVRIATGNIAQALKSYQERFQGAPGFRHYVFTPAGELVCWILTEEGKVMKDVVGVYQDVSARVKQKITQ